MALHLDSATTFNQFIRPSASMSSMEKNVTRLITKTVTLVPCGWLEIRPKDNDTKWVKVGGLVPSNTDNKSNMIITIFDT